MGRRPVRPVGLIGSVFEHEMEQVPGRDLGDGDKRPEIHQQAAVAVEHKYALVWSAERVRGPEPHRAGRDVIQRTAADRDPIERCRVNRHHNVVGYMARQYTQRLVASHGHGSAFPPTNRTTGCPRPYASSIAGLITLTSASVSITWCATP